MSEEKAKEEVPEISPEGIVSMICGRLYPENGFDRAWRRIGSAVQGGFYREAGRVGLTLAAVIVGALIQGLGG